MELLICERLQALLSMALARIPQAATSMPEFDLLAT